MNTIQEQLAAADAANNLGKHADAEQICRSLLQEELSSKDKGRLLLTLAISLWRRGIGKQAVEYSQEALDIAREANDVPLEAKARDCMGSSYSCFSDFANALDNYQQALALNREIENKAGVLNNLSNIGHIFFSRGEYQSAMEYFQEALDMSKELDSTRGIALNLGNIGSVYISLGDYEKALTHYKEALALDETLENTSGIAKWVGNIGSVYYFLGEKTSAMEYYEKALAIHKQLGDKRNIAMYLANIGVVCSDALEYSRALKYYHQALAIEEEIENISGMARNFSNIGNAHFYLAEYAQALEYYYRALAIEEQIGNKFGLAINLENIGSVFGKKEFAEYDDGKAEEFLLESIGKFRELGAKQKLYGAYQRLSELYADQERWKEHAAYQKHYYETKEEVLSEEAKKVADKYVFERQIAVMEKEREVLEKSSLEIMQAYSVIEAEKERSDALLLNILPASIAERIKEGERMIADPFDSVSILFADIVGFTSLSSKVSAAELILILNKIFVAMDRIAATYDVEKIKTIGDAYMAVSGLPIANPAHAYNMACFARKVISDVLMMKEVVDNNVNMRIGIHTGSVVAGIIGEHKFSYDIWGDSVNTASRMESHGEPGKIHISEDFKNALADYPEFTFIPRKPMTIKGKGIMNTFFLE